MKKLTIEQIKQVVYNHITNCGHVRINPTRDDDCGDCIASKDCRECLMKEFEGLQDENRCI